MSPAIPNVPTNHSDMNKGCGWGRHVWRSMRFDPHTRALRECQYCPAKVLENFDGTEELYWPRGVSETAPAPAPLMIDNRKLTDSYPFVADRKFSEPLSSPENYLMDDDTMIDEMDDARTWRDSPRSNSPRPVEKTTLRRITSKEALQLILDEIKLSPDPFAAAGVWLTLFTNGVAEITREEL